MPTAMRLHVHIIPMHVRHWVAQWMIQGQSVRWQMVHSTSITKKIYATAVVNTWTAALHWGTGAGVMLVKHILENIITVL